MYFSKNSRYVLQKARFSPCSFICLKGNDKCLSVKYPKDDPTKPPLRRNIPTDTPVECYPNVIPEAQGRGLFEQRSRNRISRSANPSAAVFDDELLPRSESEIQHPKFTPEQYFTTENLGKESDVGTTNPLYVLPFQTPDEGVKEMFICGKSKSDCESLKRADQFYEKGKNAPSSNFDDYKTQTNKTEPFDGEADPDLGDKDHKILHIIIDFPQKKDDKDLNSMTPQFMENVASKSPDNLGVPRENDEEEMKLKQPKKWRGKSLSRIKDKSNQKRFAVHEIEDSGTYVVHLKFKTPTGVEVVPEKEVTTRNAASLSNKYLRKPTQEIFRVEKVPEAIKYRERKKKKWKFPKYEIKSKSFPVRRTDSLTSRNVHAKEFLQWQQPQYYEQPVSESFEGKTLMPFLKNDYETIRSTKSESAVRNPKSEESVTPVETVALGYEGDTDSRGNGFPESAVKEQVTEVETTEAASNAEDKEFLTYSIGDTGECTEKAESDLGETRPPLTDWVVPTFVRSTADSPYERETPAEDKLRQQKKIKNSSSNFKEGKRKREKKTQEHGSKVAKSERYDSDVTDFKTGASSVTIKCDKPTYAMKLSAAYPPLLNEAMKRRYYGYRRDTVYNGKTPSSLQPKDFEMNPKCADIIPIKISKRDECSDQGGLNRNKSSSGLKISDNICEVTDENIMRDKRTPSLDSLAVMKRVKEIVDLDLNNAIKIFKPDSEGAVSSVMISRGDDGEWTLDEKELKKCLTIQKSEFLNDAKRAESSQDFFGDAAVNTPKYLPSTKRSRNAIKLDQSVMTFNPDTNKFVVDVEDLQEAIKRRTEESFDDVVVEKLEGLLTGSKSEPILVFSSADDGRVKLKSGDSILVFDEEMQQWKVDYSILEKRKERMRAEKELTKRSELILETIEKLEKVNIPSIPTPETRDRKTFDYNKEQWKDYGSETKPKNKMKSPFKESDAEEIRKKNSDLYEDLFVRKDKSKKSNALKSTEGKFCKQTGATKSGTTKETAVTPKESGTTPKEPEPINQKKESPAPPDQTAEDDNYWEAFLNMKIPARSRKKEMPEVDEKKEPKIRAPEPPPPPTPPTPPVSSPPGPKIEEPKFKIHLPFTRGKRKNEPKEILPTKPESNEEKPKASPKVKEKPKLKSSVPPGKTEKKEESKVNTPPQLQTPAKKKEEPKSKPLSSPLSPSIPSAPSNVKKEDSKTKPPIPVKKEEPKEKLISSKKKQGDLSGSVLPQKDRPIDGNKTEPKVKANPPSSVKTKEDLKTGEKKDKASADHYISENIVELSRSSKDKNSKIKSNKIETVKLNITADRKLPSKVMEINLNKNCEKPKESTVTSKKNRTKENGVESRIFYKKFEKYKTPFSDPEYEEKSMRIKSDVVSNPNLKNLSNWNKTLVLHDIAKPPENIESWLKDETDKMASLLLKVLQEATDGKPRRKSSRAKLTDKSHVKANPYDNIRKKQETASHESFLFKVRPVNLSPENEKEKVDEANTIGKVDSIRYLPVQTGGPAKPVEALEVKASGAKKKSLSETACPGLVSVLHEGKPPTLGLETMDLLNSRDFLQQCRLAGEITDDIPGPEILKKISNTWKVFPIFSVQMTIFTLLRLFQLVNAGKSFLSTSNSEKCRSYAFSKLFAKYGPIVNVQGPLSGSMILIHKSEHLLAVFEQDASIPVRSVFDSLEQSRRETKDKYLPVGTWTEWNTSQWTELKKNTQDPLIKGHEKFFSSVEAAGDSLVINIRKNKNQQNYASDDFMNEIKRWSLEGLCNVLFEKSFGFLEGRSKNMTWIMEPDKLYMSVDEATSYLSKCEKGFQTWRLMTTPSTIGLKQSYRTLSGIVAKQIYQAEANLKNKSEVLRDNKIQQAKDLTFLEAMLLNDGMTPEEITCNLIDIILIGTNAMSSALGFLLYDLAQNIKIQNKLINEVREKLPEKSSRLDYQKCRSLKYLLACLKESLRLHVPVPIFYRMLQNDILLSNYIIPKGTYVVMDYRVTCMKEQIFDEPEKFLPERWLEDEKWVQNFHPFSTLPMCHGPRAELAKRVVETQILTCAAKIVRNFHVEYQFGEIQGTDGIISFPDKPLKFNFIERDF